MWLAESMKKFARSLVSGHATNNQQAWLSAISRDALMNPPDELIITLFKMGDFIEFHGSCGLDKTSKLMKTLLNILKLKYNSVDEFAISSCVRT